MPRVVGTLLREADSVDAFASGGGGGSDWTLVRKSADEGRSATITLTADSNLVAALGVGTYLIRGVVYFSTANATMDYKFDLAFTGTATWEVAGRRFMAAGAAAGTDQENNIMQTGVIGSTAVAAATTGIARVEFEVVLDITVAGNFQFRWAQNTSDPGALTCKRGSRFEYTLL